MAKLDDYGDFLTVAQLREILGIGANSAYKLLASGQIENFKVGPIRKIPKYCLQEYISKSIASIHNSNKKENCHGGIT